MSASLILVRHSIPAIDPAVASFDWPLSAAGVDAARRLGDQLVQFKPSSVLTSPELKARQTADFIGHASSLDVEIVVGLQEHRRTSQGFLPIAEFERGIESLFVDPDTTTFGDENAAQVFDRFLASMPAVGTGKGPPVVVSHGTAISIYMAKTFGIDGFLLWRSLRTPTAIIVEGGQWSILPSAGSEGR